MGIWRWLFGKRQRYPTVSPADLAQKSPGVHRNTAAERDQHRFKGPASGYAYRLARPLARNLVAPSDIVSGEQTVPQKTGVYAWYFDLLPSVPENRYYGLGEWKLLYVGVAGRTPSSNATLRTRIVSCHLNGHASISTLRYSLGCLLAETLRLSLAKMPGSKNCVWFGDEGEKHLSEWILRHARVSWFESDTPTEAEAAALRTYGAALPLNIDGNPRNSFGKTLSKLRSAMKKQALESEQRL